MLFAPATQTIINKAQAEYLFGDMHPGYMQYQVILVPSNVSYNDPFGQDIQVDERIEDVLSFVQTRGKIDKNAF